MNTLQELIPLVFLASIYVLFSTKKGFESEIQKLFQLKGIQNVIVQSVLFVVAFVLIKYIYSQISGDLREGQGISEEELTKEQIIERIKSHKCLEKAYKNLSKCYLKHKKSHSQSGEMEEDYDDELVEPFKLIEGQRSGHVFRPRLQVKFNYTEASRKSNFHRNQIIKLNNMLLSKR